MKRILLAIVLILGFSGAGYQYVQYSSQKNVVEQLSKQIEETNSQLTQLTSEFQALPVSKYSTNTDMISAVLDTDTISLLQITAQSRDDKGQYSNVVTVQSVEETAYFTNTIARIVVDASYKDFKKAYDYVSGLDVSFSSLRFDIKNKVVSISLTPVIVGTSDISSEFTTPVVEENSTEVTEPAVTNDGVVDPDATDGSDTSIESAISSGEESTEFDIQYLGGE